MSKVTVICRGPVMEAPIGIGGIPSPTATVSFRRALGRPPPFMTESARSVTFRASIRRCAMSSGSSRVRNDSMCVAFASDVKPGRIGSPSALSTV